jgi:hypothetical protein
MSDGGGRMSEGGRRKSEVGGRKAEGGGRKAEGGGRKAEVGRRGSGVSGQVEGSSLRRYLRVATQRPRLISGKSRNGGNLAAAAPWTRLKVLKPLVWLRAIRGRPR